MATTNTGQAHPTTRIRHIIPVVAGAAVTLVLTVVTDGWLGVRSGAAPLPLAAAYRAAFTILGGHLAARLGPPGQPRLRYALALGVLLSALNIAGASAVWGQVPTWYVVSGIAFPFPSALIGGATAIRAMTSRRAGPPAH